MSGVRLPENVGFYTRAIAEANNSRGRLAPDLEKIALIGRSVVPDDWLPWLVRDAGLQALMPFVDWRVLLENGPAWLTIRGTPQASVDALSWIGWGVRFEDGAIGTSLYDHYHIHLPDVPDRVALEKIIGIERIAKSTDSVFFRLVHGYDIRAVRAAHTRFGRHIFARASGVHVRPDWPRLSFRATAQITVRAFSTAHASIVLTISAHAVRRGDIIHARSRVPVLASHGPVWAMQLGDNFRVAGDATGRAIDTIRPLAGVVGARSIHGRRQCLHLALRKIAGTRPVAGRSRHGDAFALPIVQRLMMVPQPIRLDAVSGVVPFALSADTLVISGRAGGRMPPSGGMPPPLRIVAASMTPSGALAISATASLGNAMWSGLPWSDEPWGTSPSAWAAISETEEGDG